MVTQNREYIVQKLLLRLHGGENGIYLGGRPSHPLQGHAVVGLVLGFVELKGLYIEDRCLGRLIAQGVLQNIIRLPDILLRTASDITVYAVLLPQHYRRKVLVDLAVSHEYHVEILLLPVIFRYESSLHNAVHIFRHQQTLKEKQPPQSNGCRDRKLYQGTSLTILFHHQPPSAILPRNKVLIPLPLELSELIIDKLAGIIPYAVCPHKQHRQK